MTKKNPTKYSDSISDLAETHLLCREKGHHWKHVTDKVLVWYKGDPKQIERNWKCTQCVTTMQEVLHIPSFDLVSRKYDYTEGYLLSKKATDGERINIRDIREERLVRSGLIKSGTLKRASNRRLKAL